MEVLEYREQGQDWFERYARCSSCWAAQEVCYRWKKVWGGGGVGGYRFEKIKDGWCQYKGVLRSAVAAIWALEWEAAGLNEWVEQQQRERGIRRHENSSEEEHMMRWMGLRVDNVGVQMSEMYRMFIIWGK